MAYELELPEGSKIHNVFHISCLKKAVGQHVATSSELPPLDKEGQLVLVSEEILQERERKLRSRVIREFLVKWKDLPIEDATWEGEQVLQHPNLKLLEDKQSRVGRTVGRTVISRSSLRNCNAWDLFSFVGSSGKLLGN